ncbi:MAG: DUF2812 domain-containing protein [Anaerococcus sp.]|jgi:hypothetical protein|nr:DUF2812 domain-containing protein [Anaerococcus sp.]
MNKIKIFLNPIEGREKYINSIASQGYRLVKSGSILHEFEKTNSDYKYAVQYIGYMTNKERKEYSEFLNNMNFKVFSAPLNIGKISFGNVKLRPYNYPKSMIATSPGMINNEILIIESSEGKEIPIFTDSSSKDEYLKRRKLPYYYLLVVSILLIGLGIVNILDNKSIILGSILLIIAITGICRFTYISE